MKEIKLRIKSVESTMQITKAMELVASSKLRRAKERVENSRPYFETLYATLFDIAAADSEFSSPYLAKCEKKCCLYIVIAGDRGLAGGYTMYLPKEDKTYVTRSKLEDSIAAALGGRVAEKLRLGDISTGAHSDLQHASEIAHRMVTE